MADRRPTEAALPILTVNAGSSTVKLSLIAKDDSVLGELELAAPRSQIDPGDLGHAIQGELSGADAVAHRIVHGGERYHAAVVIDRQVRREIGALTDLAPLHQPKSLAALDAVSSQLPDVPAVACFDTAFHATLAPEAFTYALPAHWRERWGLRRFGFHGLSHSWVGRHTPEMLGNTDRTRRIVSCHLGAGASLCAIADGRSVDTTMGFTPLEGLVMATRSGSVDPGLLLWLLEREAVDERQMASALEHESGLAGLTGDDDMRRVLDRAARGDAEAALGIEVYLHRLRAAIAAMAASLGGVDVLVFTGGVGEHAPAIRSGAAGGLGFLGIVVDDAVNQSVGGDGEITAAGAPVRTLVLRAREDLEMVRQTRRALGH